MYGIGGSNLLSGIKSMYVDSSVCVRIKGGEREQFRIDSGVRQGCIMSLWLFSVQVQMEQNDVGRCQAGGTGV